MTTRAEIHPQIVFYKYETKAIHRLLIRPCSKACSMWDTKLWKIHDFWNNFWKFKKRFNLHSNMKNLHWNFAPAALLWLSIRSLRKHVWWKIDVIITLSNTFRKEKVLPISRKSLKRKEKWNKIVRSDFSSVMLEGTTEEIFSILVNVSLNCW